MIYFAYFRRISQNKKEKEETAKEVASYLGKASGGCLLQPGHSFTLPILS